MEKITPLGSVALVFGILLAQALWWAYAFGHLYWHLALSGMGGCAYAYWALVLRRKDSKNRRP